MQDMSVPAVSRIMKNSRSRSCVGRWRFAILVISLLGIVWGPAVSAEDRAPASETHGTGQEQPSQAGEPAATIEGFRQARFGMNEDQVRQAVRKDFPAVGKLGSATHPTEKTTVLTLSVADLLPNSGNAHISYIFGYRSKKLIQVNVLWTSDRSNGGDETVIGTANSLRDYFLSQNYKADSVIANRQLAENTIIVFGANDLQGRTVLLVLSGVAATASTKEKKEPPLTLELAYIQDASHPDVFRIGKGQF